MLKKDQKEKQPKQCKVPNVKFLIVVIYNFL